jgi:hypothetical protein
VTQYLTRTISEAEAYLTSVERLTDFEDQTPQEQSTVPPCPEHISDVVTSASGGGGGDDGGGGGGGGGKAPAEAEEEALVAAVAATAAAAAVAASTTATATRTTVTMTTVAARQGKSARKVDIKQEWEDEQARELTHWPAAERPGTVEFRSYSTR